MCGLCGVALHPDRRDQYALARKLTTAGLMSIQKRGTHATGLAIIQDDGTSAILKKAVPADVFVRSEPYRDFWRHQPDGGMIAMGHTRWATHNNAGVDDAAHPFILGKVTGAHNGMIYNWREIEKDFAVDDEKWINDSQAPFGLLNAIKAPASALDKLDGYWALTWAKGKNLFMCRTSEAPLACAYIADKQMLVWNSEMNLLLQILRNHEITEAETWELSPSTIYRYNPKMFNDTGTHSEKTIAGFTGRKVQRSWSGVNTARPPMQTDWPAVQQGIGAQSQGGSLPRGRKMMTNADMEDLLMESLVEQEKLRAEVDYLFDVVRKAGLLDDEDDEGDDEEPLPAKQLAAPVGDDDDGLTAGNRAVMESWVVRCRSCGKGIEAGPMFKVTASGFTWSGVYHTGCVRDGVELAPLPEK